MKAKKIKKASIIGSAIILVIVLALNVAVGLFHSLIDANVIGYKDSENSSAARADGQQLAEQIQGEGTVLVKNNGLLPMKSAALEKVNVFGWDSVDWVISGSGSGQVKCNEAVDLLEALDEAHIQYNTELSNMYKNFYEHREFSQNGGGINGASANAGSLKSFNYEFSRLYEPSIEDKNYYSDSLLQNAQNFSDTAIVAIGRVSGESNDSPKVQYKRTTKNGELITDNDRTYLEISTEEEALLNYVASNFDKVIVLINSTNVMELGFLEDIEGIDAALITATTGSVGTKAIPRLLCSDIVDEEGNDASITPSGKTADTYAYDLSTSSTYADTGSGNPTTNFYTNSNGLYPTTVQHTNGSKNEAYAGVAYTDYREGIYMGYKWYETADKMGFWNSDYAKNLWGISKGYEDVVQYPFGFGLSYTTFQWSISKMEMQIGDAASTAILNNSVLSDPSATITIGVTVENTGDYAGQDVVELYYEAPYTENGIEKSSVNLLAFGKTVQVLQPGEKGYVELSFKVSDMKSYDYNDANNNGFSGYELEKGNYTLTLRTDSHTLAGSKVSGDDTLTFKINNDMKLDKDDTTGNTVENRFTGNDTTDGVAIDGNSDGNADITYLSRSKFTTTFPEKLGENRAMTDAIKALNLYTAQMANAAINQADAAITTGDTTQGGVVYENGSINELGLTLGKDYNADEWDGVLNRMTLTEMQNLVLHGYTQTLAVTSIGKPETKDLDGPNQIGSFSGGVSAAATGFSSIVLAQTWNKELAYSMGLAFGTECASYGIVGWYGPALNPHRSPFGGRNYEYYSEDALIGGTMASQVVQGAKNKGVFCYLKHLCLYETESGRDGMYTWLTEQSLREVYIKPFESVVKNGATGIMTSYGRIGAVWTGGSKALLTEVVRGEWGFQGAFLTDYSDHQNFMNGDQMVRAGGDLWMDGYQDNGKFQFETTSGTFQQALRNACKNIIYMWLNALATNYDYNEGIKNGTIQDNITIPATPELNFRWYIPLLVAIDVIAVAGCALWIILPTFKKDAEAEA